MLKAVLFDLDGTLLPLDLDLFIKKYFEALGPYFAHKIEPKIFLKELMLSTEEMIKNIGQFTNEEVFMDNFLPRIKANREEMYPLFEKFYEEEFPKLKEHTGYTCLAREIVGHAFQKGYKIVLATNPIFPRKAVEHRMEWAGVLDLPWSHITYYENSRFSKPNPAYFQDISDKLGVMPEECLMVGNDVQEDLVSSTIGMKTFLVTDCLINRGNPLFSPDYEGDYLSLHKFIFSLPQIGK
ncbi:MAG: HAD family hydrolase [Bacillota bacterium]